MFYATISGPGHFTLQSRFKDRYRSRCRRDAAPPRPRIPEFIWIAVDLHVRPAKLPLSVDWLQTDLNQADFHEKIGRKADVVYATAVWEHAAILLMQLACQKFTISSPIASRFLG